MKNLPDLFDSEEKNTQSHVPGYVTVNTLRIPRSTDLVGYILDHL